MSPKKFVFALPIVMALTTEFMFTRQANEMKREEEEKRKTKNMGNLVV